MSIVVCQAQDQIVSKNERNESFTQKGDMGGLSFLQSMFDITTIVREDKAYVYPVEKRSVSKLNEKSLEMCTESLGAETGSESGDELSLLAFEATTIPRIQSPPREEEKNTDFPAKKSTMSRNKSFPPPIKFLKESKYNRMVRSIGEDGRVVVQAIRVSSPPRYFVAERGEGRLRLCLSPEFRHINHEEEETEESMKEEEDSENLDDINGDKKFSRLSSRCKENGREPKPMLTWKQQQFWVAT